MCVHCCVRRRRGPAPKERAGDVRLALNIVRRTHRKHQTFFVRGSMITLSLGSRRLCTLSCSTHCSKTSYLQLIYGFGASDSSSLAMHGAQLHPGSTQDAGARCGLETLPICSNTVNADSHRRRRTVRFGGLARPEHRTVTQSTPNIAASPPSAPSRARRLRTGNRVASA